MGNNIRILHFNEVDDATLSASSEASGRDVENVQDEGREKRWRSASISGQWIKVHKTGISAKCIAMTGVNLTHSAQITVSANIADSWDEPPFSETFYVWDDFYSENRTGFGEGGVGDYGVGGWDIDIALFRRLAHFRPVFIGYFSAAQSYTWWLIEFTDPGNPDGYLDVGRIYLGDYFELSAQLEYGSTKQVIDQSEVSAGAGGEEEGGAEYVDLYPSYHTFQLKFQKIITTECQRYISLLQERCGHRKCVFLDLYPGWNDAALSFLGKFYGRLKTSPIEMVQYNRHATVLPFRETVA
jgi:hypothetical protein